MSIVSPLLHKALGGEEVLLRFPGKPFKQGSCLGLLVQCYSHLPYPTRLSVTRNPKVLTSLRKFSDCFLEVTEEQAVALYTIAKAINHEYFTCGIHEEVALLKILFDQDLPEIMQLQIELGNLK